MLEIVKPWEYNSWKIYEIYGKFKMYKVHKANNKERICINYCV